MEILLGLITVKKYVKRRKENMRYIVNITTLINELNKVVKTDKLQITIFVNEYLIRFIELLRDKLFLVTSYSLIKRTQFPIGVALAVIHVSPSIRLRFKKSLFTLYSSPSRQRFFTYYHLTILRNLYILNTTKGLVLSNECYKWKIGGQVVCKINIV